MLRLLHKLEVHQVELKGGNSELRRARDEMESALERYTDLYDFAPVAFFSLYRDGAISAVNLTGAPCWESNDPCCPAGTSGFSCRNTIVPPLHSSSPRSLRPG